MLDHGLTPWPARARHGPARDLGERGGAGGPGTHRDGDAADVDAAARGLVGRSEVVAALIEAVGDGRSPRPRLFRLAGESGVGKSAVAAAVRPHLRAAGLQVIGGKYEQVERASPYGAFVQAFLVMLRWILAQDDDAVAHWRERITRALAPNTQVLLELMPEYERLLGPQPPLPTLGLAEQRIRTGLVARRFAGALAGQVPLVIELDDLQWADRASLALLETLIGDDAIENLTIIATYRDNEVDAHHPATLVFARAGSERPLPPTIELRGLDAAQTGRVLREAIEAEGDPPDTWTDLPELARIVHRKTQGNPLFVRQFAATLLRKGLLETDRETRRLSFDARRIARERFTDNVVDLVIDRIRALPAEAREMVEIAACCIQRIDRPTLRSVSGRSADEVEAALRLALEADVLRAGTSVAAVPDPGEERAAGANPDDGDEEGFAFQHDKVREGAYALLDPARRSALHAALAQGVESEAAGGGRGEMLLADHAVAGRAHLAPALRERLGAVLAAAATAARRVNAYVAALSYLDVALEHAPDLPPGSRARFDAGMMRAETLYLLGRTDEALALARSLADEAPDDEARVAVLRLKVTLLTAQLAYREALEVGAEALKLLGEPLSIDPSTPALLGQVVRTRAVIGRRGVDDLLALAPMKDPRKLAAMGVLDQMAPPAYFVSRTLLPAISMRMVQLSVRHGNAPESAYAYALYGIIHTALLRSPARGLTFGELGLRAAEAPDARKYQGGVMMVHAGFLLHWTAPLRETLPMFLSGAERAIANGDLMNHGYLRYGHASYALMAGLPLGEVDAHLAAHLEAVTRFRHEKTIGIMTMARASIARIRGRTGPPFDEEATLRVWREQADATSLAYHHKYRMLEALMAADYEAVLREAEGMTRNLHGIFAMAYQHFYPFYEALALVELAKAPGRGRVAGRRLRWRAARLARCLARWSAAGTPGLAHRVVLIRAELAAARGAAAEAMRLFDRAAHDAREAGALHDVALTLERTGLFHKRLGARDTARRSFGEAVAAYREWGAHGWAAALAARQHLEEPSPLPKADGADEADTTAGGAESALDAFVACHDVGEIARDMAALLMERCRAARVVVLTADESGTRVAALRGGTRAVADEGVPYAEMVVNYVLRTREPLTLERAGHAEPFASDPFIQGREGLAVAAVPLVVQDRVLGAVYLEWSGALPAAATAADGMRRIAAQGAVALQNARLVAELNASLDRQVELTSAHARFVPHAVLDVIGRPSIEQVRLGDFRQRHASVLFSDIRGFTARLETLAPHDALDFVNGYLALMEPFVQENGGFVDSYIGDAVMAVFERGPEAAVRTAGAMQRALVKWRGVEAVPLSESLRIGVGIASGELIFATLGAASRLKVGVVGDVVNVAARTEGLTTTYDCPILATRETVEGLPPDLERWTRPVGQTQVKGREAPVSLFEVFHAASDAERERKRETRPLLERYSALQTEGRLREAREVLAAEAERFAHDPLIRALLRNSKR